MARTPSLWVVVRFAPSASSWSDGPEFYTLSNDEDEKPQGAPVASFVEREDAEAEAARLHALAVRETSIGLFMHELLPTALAPLLSEAARAAGLPEPDFARVGPVVKPRIHSLGYEEYGPEQMAYSDKVRRAVREWWDGIAETISPDALATLWGVLFFGFSFYSVGRVLLEE